MGCLKLDILEQDYTCFGLAEITAGSSLCSRESGCKTRKMYRYGFQGQETENEMYGDGNASFYKYRISNNWNGRFFAVDPLAPEYPHNSTYAFSENRVIDGVELEGLEYNPLSLMYGQAGITTVTVKEIEYNVEQAFLKTSKVCEKVLSYAGCGVSIVYGGAPGIILGIPSLGLLISKDIGSTVNPNGPAKDAPSSFGETIGMIPDKLYEKNTGEKTNVGKTFGGFVDSYLTSPLNKVGTTQSLSLIPSTIGQTVDAALSTGNTLNSISNTSIQWPSSSENTTSSTSSTSQLDQGQVAPVDASYVSKPSIIPTNK